jgi:hypothetical protein
MLMNLYNRKLVPVEILDLKIGDHILINFYNNNKIIHSKSGYIEKIDLNRLYDDVSSFVKIKNYKGEIENILYEDYNYSIFLI